MLLHLGHYTSPPLQHHNSCSSYINKLNNSIFLPYGFRVSGDINDDPFAFKKVIRVNAVDRDSEFEVDPDKAREALQKLDEQLQSLSSKQVNTPKIRAVDVNQSSPRMNQDTSEVSGSFLTYVASALLFFTILYNIIFVTVIKPSVDGPDSVSPATESTQEGSQLKPLSISPERKFPAEP